MADNMVAHMVNIKPLLRARETVVVILMHLFIFLLETNSTLLFLQVFLVLSLLA